MFYLYQSNRLESLAELFAKIQQVQPLQDALAAEEIVVQSQGMRRYLSNHLAQANGVAANLRFSLPAGLTWRLMREQLPDIPALSPFAPEVMRWRLLDLFRSEAFQGGEEFALVREVLAAYLGSGESADYQLAGQLADMFDQYLVYRPQWIEAWQQGRLLDLGDDEAWQADLWRFLDDGSQTAAHRVALWEQLLAALPQAELPQRFFVFGIATMAPMYLQLLQALAQHCDVFVFALNPSEHYWGNVIEAAQILKGGDDVDLSQSGHPLLASLGKQGRDFFDFLSEIEHEIPVFEDAFGQAQSSALHRLQHDIQTLTMPSENSGAHLSDGSIQIVAAHSPLRELQILKDRILATLQQYPEWQPHDIAVLTPNIEPYLPFIGAVFGQSQGGAQALPYSVSDVRISRRQPLLHALERVADVLESRFEVDKVWPLLESEQVLARFDLSEDDLPLLHDTVGRLNVHWGLDETMRGGDSLFTWQQALERVVLGWMLPQGGGLWQNVSAWHGDVNQMPVLSRFATFVRTLADTRREWQRAAGVAEWAERIRRLMAQLFAPQAGDQYAVQQFEQALAQWQQEAELAGFDGDLPQHTVLRHIGRFLGSESQAGFLRGGITFCSMVPMRSLPFKMLCLIGLNDGDFPRNTKAAAFDLIAKHPQKGDRARRDDDRYLFLEAIISAREILYLSYVGRSIRNDDELAPSALVSELIDTLAAMSGRSSRDLQQNWVEHHPLQPFSHRYFSGENGLQSTRQDYADALNLPAEAAAPFFRRPFHEADETEPQHTVIQQDSLIAFWKNPVKSWLRQNLGWREPYRDDTWEAAEPFEPENAEAVADAYLNARRSHQDFAATAERVRAESLLPAGELGSLWQQRFQAEAKSIDAALLNSEPLPPFAYTLEFEQYTLEGSLKQLHKNGRIVYANRRLSNPDHIANLLEHLIFCAVAPTACESRESHLIGNGEVGTYPAIAPEQARALLAPWLAYYRIGQHRPLPFFAKTAWETAREYVKKQDWEAAKNKALSAYRGNKMSKGQEAYTEVALVFGRDETLPVDTPLFENLMVEMLAPALAAVAASEGEE